MGHILRTMGSIQSQHPQRTTAPNLVTGSENGVSGTIGDLYIDAADVPLKMSRKSSLEAASPKAASGSEMPTSPSHNRGASARAIPEAFRHRFDSLPPLSDAHGPYASTMPPSRAAAGPAAPASPTAVRSMTTVPETIDSQPDGNSGHDGHFSQHLCGICYCDMDYIPLTDQERRAKARGDLGFAPDDSSSGWRAHSHHYEHWQKDACEHIFCTSCMQDYVQDRISTGHCVIPCPENGCEYKLWNLDVRNLCADRAQYEKFKALQRANYGERLVQVAQDKELFDGLKNVARPCPKCCVITYRYDGCEAIMCTCGCLFCYNCGVEYDQAKDWWCRCADEDDCTSEEIWGNAVEMAKADAFAEPGTVVVAVSSSQIGSGTEVAVDIKVHDGLVAKGSSGDECDTDYGTDYGSDFDPDV